MKTFVLTVAQRFPAHHPRRGEPTFFIQSIAEKSKIHTIRANYPLWKKRIDEVKAGEAVISLRTWTSTPYNSKQQEIGLYDYSSEIGIQKIQFASDFQDCIIDFRRLDIAQTLALNDGLAFKDLKHWFRPGDTECEMAIIHFTNFRYN